MHITLEADYAVRIVEFLAISSSIQDAGKISKETNVSLRFSLKILRKLVFCGIVKSYKGSRGGYILNKDPSEITLRQVIEAVEGKYVFSRCLTEKYDCNNTYCRFYEVYDDISALVRKKLDEFTFDMVVDKKENCKKCDI